MKDQCRSIRLVLTLLFSLCVVTLAAVLNPQSAICNPQSYTVYLPLVHKYSPPEAKLGVDFGGMITMPEVLDYDLPVAKEMGAHWVRVFLGWLEIETSPGEYTWDKYDPVFERLGELELSAMVVMYGAPDWAAVESCGPISDTLALENFLDVLVPRYAHVVDAWEFINEPDGREPHVYGPAIGCWGLHPAEYAQQLASRQGQKSRSGCTGFLRRPGV